MSRCFCPNGPTFAFVPRPGYKPKLDNCERPSMFECLYCTTKFVWPCGATREDRCEPCGKKHRQRLKRVVGSGFSDSSSSLFFNTATAPGAHRLPWDTSKCLHPRDRPCSGKDFGCVVERVAAAVWNAHAPQVWSWIMTEIRRRLPGVDVQFWKCWETQIRGVLHLHAIIRALGVTEKRMRKIWKDVLKKSYEMDRGYVFQWGTEQTCDRIGSAHSVAELIELHGFDPEEAEAEQTKEDEAAQLIKIRYVAKYCTKGGKRASTVNLSTGEIRDDGRGYRTWSASSRWGLTMKQIREHQRDWIAQQGAGAGGRASGLGLAPGSEATLDTNTDFYAEGVPLNLFDPSLQLL